MHEADAESDTDTDTDTDSDDEEESPRPYKTRHRVARGCLSMLPRSLARLISLVAPLSGVQRDVLKCAIAYLLASLFTYNHTLASVVGAPLDQEGPVRNAHVIATVAVFFHPARTVGAMVEADILVLLGAAYAAFLSCGSMATTVVLDDLGLEDLSHWVVILGWILGGYASM